MHIVNLEEATLMLTNDPQAHLKLPSPINIKRILYFIYFNYQD